MVANTKLGVGLYTPSEAARLVRAHPRALARWLYGTASHDAVVNPKFSKEERVVTFLDLIQSLAIRTARQRPRRVPLPKIREAIQNARKDYKLDTPLAYKHRLYFYDNSIVIRLENKALVGLTGRDRNQGMISEIVESFMDEIDWSETDGLAQSWTPTKSDHFEVVLDPKTRFGQPMVREKGQPVGLLAETLADAADSEGGIEGAALAHDIDPEAVLLALKYRDQLAGIVS